MATGNCQDLFEIGGREGYRDDKKDLETYRRIKKMRQ